MLRNTNNTTGIGKPSNSNNNNNNTLTRTVFIFILLFLVHQLLIGIQVSDIINPSSYGSLLFNATNIPTNESSTNATQIHLVSNTNINNGSNGIDGQQQWTTKIPLHVLTKSDDAHTITCPYPLQLINELECRLE